ncbi:MAG: glycosyltransferase [Micrococcales bacterium]|nr:glycosyltransferase [Micrococcales bacterium]
MSSSDVQQISEAPGGTDRFAGRSLYLGASTITGPLVDSNRVHYRKVMSRGERFKLGGIIALNLLFGVGFVVWLLLPWHLPMPGEGISPVALLSGYLAITMVVGVEVVRVLQTSSLWIFGTVAQDPVPMVPEPGLRVAVLTTIVPSKEPVDLVMRTLRAMKRLEHDGTLDVWILDEGDDPEVRQAAQVIGVKHFSRKGIARWNTESGAFKAKTKAGNHNAWRDAHESDYDVVAQMDPDHVPLSDFLTRTLGYFREPDIAFVVAPQVYGNLYENWIAHGAASQAYVFHGIVQRGGNGMGAPLLIGTNHLYRPTAFAQIGGYQDSIIEDHVTAMAVYAATNPATGHSWRGVYTPDILAIGEGPTSFTDYFNQQKRWAYGIWDVIGNKSHRMLSHVSPAQRLSFSLLQIFYPAVAVGWLLANLATGLYLLGAVSANIEGVWWVALWFASLTTSLLTFFWMRRFNLVEHERRELGLSGIGLTLTAIPIYVSAALSFLAGRPLAYAVTAKGDLTSPDRLSTFRPHLFWVAGGLILLLAGMTIGPILVHPTVAIWALVTIVVAAVPIAIHLAASRKKRPN